MGLPLTLKEIASICDGGTVMRALLAIVGTVALITTNASAAVDPPPVAKKPIDPQQKIVCKTEDFVGSLIPRRICKTKADWDEGAIDAKAALDQQRLKTDPVKLSGGGGG